MKLSQRLPLLFCIPHLILQLRNLRAFLLTLSKLTCICGSPTGSLFPGQPWHLQSTLVKLFPDYML
ncbi:hypothetical protein BGX38DRAFT_1183846 [Terfezia claveryi]|nr:hypothetical protein BGX38DRAFT_1183846 [Terfezia claveryi]